MKRADEPPWFHNGKFHYTMRLGGVKKKNGRQMNRANTINNLEGIGSCIMIEAWLAPRSKA